MCRRKLTLSILLTILFLSFLANSFQPEAALFLFILPATAGVLTFSSELRARHDETYSKGTPSPLPLIWIGVASLFAVFSFPYMLTTLLLLYGMLYLLLILFDRLVLMLQRVPGKPLLAFFGFCLSACIPVAFSLAYKLHYSGLEALTGLVVLVQLIGIVPLLIELFLPQKKSGNPLMPLPLLFSSFYPYLLVKLTQLRSQREPLETEPDAQLFVHVADTKYGKLGHTDLYFDHQVISFGGYDADTQRLDGMFGEGMFFLAPGKENYLNFCRNYSKKTIVCFGIHLTEMQKNKLRKEISQRKEQARPWFPQAGSTSEYAVCLQQATGAQFYKFTHGPWKTYFILRNNCTRFCNALLSPLGIACSGAILTPGCYYTWLNRQWQKKNGFVVSKEVVAYREETRHVPASPSPQEKQQRI